MTSEAPSHATSWINEEYIEQVLRSFYGTDKLVLVTHRLEEKSDGKGVCALIMKLNVNFQLESNKKIERNFIVKAALPSSDTIAKLCEEDDIFETEMEFYRRIVPLMEELWNKYHISQKVFPKTLAISKHHKTIILEDLLINKEYTSENRRLNMEQSKLFLDKIALFHATTAVVQKKAPFVSEEFLRGMFHPGKMFAKIAFEEMFNSLVRCAGSWNIDLSHINYLQKTIEVCQPNPNHFNCLIHGDCHKNNFFMKTDSSDLTLIDFQEVKWSSPALDLHLFLPSTVDTNLFYEKEHEMVHYYYSRLVEYLKCLLFEKEIPTFEKFLREYEEKRFYSLTGCLLGLYANCELSFQEDFDFLLGQSEKDNEIRDEITRNGKDYVVGFLKYFQRKYIL